MKHLICLILTFLLLFFSGCQREEDPSVQFFYRRAQYVYGSEDGVIASETRDISTRDYGYLLRLYLKGPQNELLVSPFPANTRLISTHMDDGVLTVGLSEEFAALKNMDLSIAAACFASTCFDLTDAQTVRIIATSTYDEVSIVLSRESLTLIDSSAESSSATE